MKKPLVLIGIVVNLVSVRLSRSTSTEHTTEQTPADRIIRNWYDENQSVVVNDTFYENHSTYLTLGITSVWTGYERTEDHIIITSLTDGSSTSYAYSFTDNNQKLSITSSEGEITVLTRR